MSTARSSRMKKGQPLTGLKPKALTGNYVRVNEPDFVTVDGKRVRNPKRTVPFVNEAKVEARAARAARITSREFPNKRFLKRFSVLERLVRGEGE